MIKLFGKKFCCVSPNHIQIEIDLVEWYLHQLCRVARQERYGGDAGGSYE